MKKLVSFLVMALVGMTASAQMIAYQVTTNVVGEPGTPTVIDLQGTTGTNLSKVMFDADENIEFNSVEEATGFPIGFEFGYNGQKMTHFLIGGDGEIQLSPTEKITTDVHKDAVNMFTKTGIHDCFGIVARQGFYGLEDTQISYWLEGVEGTYALCIEYKNVDFKGTYNAENDYCGAKATIQYRLYQKSGNIEMKVKGFKPENTGSYNFMRIGILGDEKDFVQVQSWDGTLVSATDKNISYSVDSYPQDGMVYTFVAPDPCVTPAEAPTDLQLTSTSTQISGTFTPGSADYYLVLVTTESELSEQPVDGSKYVLNQEVGNAKVIAIVQNGEFTSPQTFADLLTPGVTYNVFVYGYNSLCLNGPLYNATPATATLATKPDAPEALTVTATEKNSLTLSVTAAGDAPVLIAMTNKPGVNSSLQVLSNGNFGVPTGDYNVGDVITFEYEDYDAGVTATGENTIVYVGGSNEAIVIEGLEPGQNYYFRAWSSDGNGAYSSLYTDAADVTVAELPWEFPWANYGDFTPVGWTFSSEGTSVWSDFYRNDPSYFYSQINAANEEGTDTWAESPYIEMGADGTTVMFGLAGTQRSGWMQSDWTLADGEYVAIQLTKDDVDFTEVLRIDNTTVTSLASGSFTDFSKRFNDFAGEKARFRIFIHRTTAGQTQFANLKLAGQTYGIVGNIPGMTWDDDLVMTESADNKNIYTATFNVTVEEVPAEAYEYKLRANGNWDGYQIPETGNQSWMPAEAGDYSLVFTADIEANTLTLSVQRPFEVSFKNENYWSTVYAYTWSVDGEGNVTEYSGAWPGTLVEASGSWMNRSWTYNFTAEEQPQFIIWSNGGGSEWEEAEQTGDFEFVNHKVYSYYPEITSVQLPGTFNDWNATDMAAGDYDNRWVETITPKEDVEFKLLINGTEWLGYNDVTIEDPNGWLAEGSENGNILLKHSEAQKSAYEIVAYWLYPGSDVKSGWLISVDEGEAPATNVSATRTGNQPKGIYNLNGVRQEKIQRGVNIVDGTKVVVKK